MRIPITAFFFCIFSVLYIGLSLYVVRTRRKNRIPLGDGNHPPLIKAMSTHSNFSQYIPLGLLGILMGELQGIPSSILFGVGFSLLLGRMFHGIGIMIAKTGPNKPRVLGMILTFIPLLTLAVANILLLK